MDILINVVLPLSLAFIMFCLGIGLELADFKRVSARKRAFFIGLFCQIMLLPIATYVIAISFGLSGEMAAGFMLLGFCPGGVTSNVISRFARGDVALSVSLTAVVSLLSIFTVPILVAWAVTHFMGADAPDISVRSLAIAMFLITALPVALGMLLRAFATEFVLKFEKAFLRVASVLFALIVIAAIVGNWDIVTSNAATLGLATGALVIVMLIAGLVISSLAGLSWAEKKTIAIEAGIQNGTLGITLAPLIVGTAAALPVLALPSAMYGVAMYVIGLPFAIFMRNKNANE